jgi:tetratricopeptide (TPR) repeat protein
MSRSNKSGDKKPGQSESFEERIDVLFEELSFAFQQQRPSILLAYYEIESVRDRAEGALEKRLAEIKKPLVQFRVDEGHFDIPLLLSQHPDRDHSVYSVTCLSRGGGRANANAYRALNMRREYFVDYAIRVVLWLARDEAIELSRNAPDFWAFRHRVVEFYDSLNSENPRDNLEFLDRPEKLDEQIELMQAALSGLQNKQGSARQQVELLYKLAALYHAGRAYAQSIQRSRQGLQIARQLNDLAWQAKFCGKLGLIYLDLDQPERAVRACRKATRLDPLNADLWRGLGHFYHIEKRFSDAIIAYQNALRLDPQNPWVFSSLMACYRISGKDDLLENHQMVAQSILQNATEYQRALYASVCGNTLQALDLLQIALEKNQVEADQLRHEPDFDFIRADARFAKILDSLGAQGRGILRKDRL